MRRYAPHNAHVSTFSAPSFGFTRARIISSLRVLVASLPTLVSPLPRPLPVRPCASPDDDVHAEPRLRALRRWLAISAPLAREEALSLRMFMRPTARVVRAEPLVDCPLCTAPLSLRERQAAAQGEAFRPPTTQRSPWLLNGSWIFHLAALAMFWLVYVFLALVARITGFGRRIKRRRLAFHVRRSWLAQLEDAECYSAWYAAAEALDHVEANSRWKAGDIRAAGVMNGLCARCADTWNSPALQRKRAKHGSDVTDRIESVVNLDMLTAKLNELAVLYKQGDIRGLAFSLRASLIRNLGGMCHPELHEYSRVGTNQIVEDYVNVTSYLLAYIAQSQSQQTGLYSRRESPVLSTSAPISGVGAMNELQLDPRDQRWNERSNSLSKRIMIAPDTSTVHESDAPPLLSVHDKLTFFNEARHAYGRTALMLSGGAAMGLSHMGVVKALLNQGLLPRVVCGTSAGALVASMVGIFDDDELASIFSTESLINPITKVPLSFRFFDDHTTVLRRIRRFLRKGYIQDVRMLQDCLRRNFGDLTFEEAYMKTRRILNITVCPLRSSSDPPLLLNYLTAPHVLIWSAASASCALPLVFAPVELVTKSANGRLVPYHPDGVRWIDGSISSDVPLSRIGELFNVNHFIVSQTNPHVIPRSMPILNTRFAMLVKSEFQFRYWQLLQMGMVPKLLTAIFPHFMQPYAGDVTIMPDVRLSDLTKLLRNPTSESVHGSIRRGEIQTFPFLDRIRLHCLIEQTLDRSVESVATAAKGDETPLSSSSPRRGSALFGRVPSWLWLDTRSILSSSAMKAVASRFTKRGERGDEEEIVELDDDYEEGASEASSDDVMVAKRRRGNRVRKLCGPDSADVTLDGILMELSRETLSGEPLPDPVEYHFPGLADDSEGSAEDERPMC